VGLFAVPALMDRTMREEVAAGRLSDLGVATRPMPLTAAQLDGLRRLPNVAAVSPQSFYATRVLVGARRAQAYVIGVPDFPHQTVDVIRRTSGTDPAPGEVLTDVQNARQDRYGGGRGAVLRALAADGRWTALRVSGEGRSLEGAQSATEDKVVVLYADPATVETLSGRPGYGWLAFRLHDRSRAAVDRTIAAVRGRLRATVPEFTGFATLPEIRPPGSWPGKEGFDDFSSFFSIVTLLALLSALVLIANTMTSLIAEQSAEIATMRAIGGRRRQVAAIYLRTAAILGGLGAALGVVLGVALGNALVSFLANSFYGINARFGIDVPIVVAATMLGVLGTMAAAAPAIRRGLRRPIAEGLQSTGVQATVGGALDRALRRLRGLPRSAQIGLRGVGRRKRRSLATAAIVAVAVGNLLAVMALADGTLSLTRKEWDDRTWQVQVGTNLRRPFDAHAAQLITSTPGVAAAEPEINSDIDVGGEAYLYGVRQRTAFHYRIKSGRWYSPAEERAGARVAVLESNLARARGLHVGDPVRLTTATGPAALRVIGIADNQQEDGLVAFVPLTTAQRMLAAQGGVNHYWVTTTSSDHSAIDRTTTRLEDRLTAAGYSVDTEITYVGKRDNVAANRTIIMTLAVLGFLVVAISMVGLVNAITMNVIERTREIGILRSIGARARDVRRVFGTEGVALAIAGWAAGIAIGWGLDRVLVWLVREVVGVRIPATFPAGNVVIALAATVVLAVAAMVLPLRRAARLRPGDALRYT
jgi:putative ABC transport system permease protein